MSQAPAPRAANRAGLITFALCFLVAMIDGFDTLIMSFIAPALATDWSLSDGALGSIFSAGLIGAAGGAFLSGMAADRIGRRPTLLLCVALFTLTAFASAWAQNPAVLIALRVLGGLGLGGAIPAITAMTAETASPEKRSAAVTRMFIGFPAGAVAGGALSAWLVEAYGWRSAFILGGAAPLVLLPFLWAMVKEPEAWAHGHQAPAETGGVFGAGRAPASACLLAAAFLILLLGYFLVSWIPMTLARAGMADGAAALGAVTLNVGGIAGAFLITAAFRRFGPFAPIGVALIAGAALVAILGQVMGMASAAYAMIFLTGAMVIGAQLNLPTMASELFPLTLRATGVGATMAVGRLGSIIGPILGGLLLAQGLAGPQLFLALSIPALLGGVAILLLSRVRPAR